METLIDCWLYSLACDTAIVVSDCCSSSQEAVPVGVVGGGGVHSWMGSTSHLCVCTSPDVLNLSLVLFCITLITASTWNVSMFYSLSMIEPRSCRPPWYMLLVLQRCRLHTQKKNKKLCLFFLPVMATLINTEHVWAWLGFFFRERVKPRSNLTALHPPQPSVSWTCTMLDQALAGF